MGIEVDLVDALVQFGEGEVQATLDPIQVALVDGETGIEVAALEEVAKLALPLVEFGDVTGQEVAARRVEQLDIAVVDDH